MTAEFVNAGQSQPHNLKSWWILSVQHQIHVTGTCNSETVLKLHIYMYLVRGINLLIGSPLPGSHPHDKHYLHPGNMYMHVHVHVHVLVMYQYYRAIHRPTIH